MAKLLAKHNVVFQVARDDCTTTTMSFDARVASHMVTRLLFVLSCYLALSKQSRVISRDLLSGVQNAENVVSAELTRWHGVLFDLISQH